MKKMIKFQFYKLLGVLFITSFSLAGMAEEGSSGEEQPGNDLYYRQKVENHLTLLKNKHQLIPLRHLDTLQLATVSIGVNEITPFQKMANQYAGMDHYVLPADYNGERLTKGAGMTNITTQLGKYNLVLVSVHLPDWQVPREPRVNDKVKHLINDLASSNKAIFTVFGAPYVLHQLPAISKNQWLLMGYHNKPLHQELSAQLLFGAIGAKGRLNYDVGQYFNKGRGLQTKPLGRLKYTIPEEAGINGQMLSHGVDSLVNEALSEKATPGCQVLVAKSGKVIFQKSYGYHTYDSINAVVNSDLYDLASITKVASSAPALMKLYDQGQWDVDSSMGKYIPELKNTNKENLIFREVLAHQGGLKPSVPFWQDLRYRDGDFRRWIHRGDSSGKYNIKISDNLFLNTDYQEKFFKMIKTSELINTSQEGFTYSDLSFYFFPDMIRNITGKSFQRFLHDEFFAPIGAHKLTFNAFKYFPVNMIVPTEYDKLFRKTLLRGHVHDEAAAIMQGVSGHAGLFGNANDLAKILQMFIQNGQYGGRQYISDTTIKTFTSYQFPDNRRGIIFDKPKLEYEEDSNAARDASGASFGHSGFTGTYAWADPETELVYIFLSNRVYPSRRNYKIYKLDTRTKIHQVIYDAMEKG